MIALLTNDDGIEAEGLASLRERTEEFFDEVWLVAPASQMSEIGHRVTTQEPIRFEKREEKIFAVHGTPADCTRVALAHLLPQKPDWVLSGINHGGNLGRHDFAISGTVAAVREAAFADLPGVAFSHFLKQGREPNWKEAKERCAAAFREILKDDLAPGDLWTVNLPHPDPEGPEPKIVFCDQEKHPLEVIYKEVSDDELVYVGDYHERPRVPGSDVSVCFGGDVAVSKIRV